MDITSKILEIITNIITMLAIGWGVFWTYYLFIKNRQKYPRAEVKHKLTQKYLGNGKILLHVVVEVINLGDVLVDLESGKVRLLQVLPLDEDINKIIQSGEDPVSDGKFEIGWPLLFSRKLLSKEQPCEIEPKESESFQTDFVVDNDLQTVSIYSFFQNKTKKGKDLGWACTTIHDIEGGTTIS